MRAWLAGAALLAVLPAGATTPGGASLRIENESAPPGGVALLRIELTEPKPIPVGELSLRFDRRFVNRLLGAGAFSDTFELIGTGTLRAQDFLFRFFSLDGRLGLAPDMPILVIALEVDPGAAAGAQAPVTAEPAGQGLLDPTGRPYPAEVKPGTLTVEGVSVDRVSPGTGEIAAGTTVRFEGHGFQPGAEIDIEGVALDPAVWISPAEMRAAARQTFTIDGRRIRLRNPDGSEDIFFSYTPLPANASQVEVFQRTVPFFGRAVFESARILYPVPVPFGGGAEGLAVQNPGREAVEVTVGAFSSGGAALGEARFLLPGETVHAYGVGELIPGAPPGTVGLVTVRSARPVKVLGLVAEPDDEKVTPVQAESAAPPVIFAGGVVDAGGYSARVAPGTIVAIFGKDFAAGQYTAQQIPLPLELGGVSVTFDGVRAPLFFVSEGQINAQAPFDITGPEVEVRVTAGGQRSNAMAVGVSAAAPGLLTQDASGSGLAAAVDASTGTLVTPAAPLGRGGFATLYLVGLGAVSNQPAAGAAAPFQPLAETLAKPEVRLGGDPAEVTFSGMTPGSVGLYQINIRIPENAPVGAAVSLQVSVGGAASNVATVAIQ